MSNQYFVHDSFNGQVEYFDTEKEANDYANECIGDGHDGWNQEILDGAIKTGVVLFESSETNRRDSENPDWNYVCDVEMVDVECELIENLQSKLKAQQELIDELSDLVKEISERLNEHSRVAIHKDSIVHVRMKRAIAKLEEK